jgi:hypothetical protein
VFAEIVLDRHLGQGILQEGRLGRQASPPFRGIQQAAVDAAGNPGVLFS